MRIVVFGGNDGTGACVVRQALARGDEVVSMSRRLFNVERPFIREFTADDIHQYRQVPAADKLVRAVEWGAKQVEDVFQDYVEHMYPAFEMTPNSFRCFVFKLGVLEDQAKWSVGQLFRAFAAPGTRGLAEALELLAEQLHDLVALGDPRHRRGFRTART